MYSFILFICLSLYCLFIYLPTDLLIFKSMIQLKRYFLPRYEFIFFNCKCDEDTNYLMVAENAVVG